MKATFLTFVPVALLLTAGCREDSAKQTEKFGATDPGPTAKEAVRAIVDGLSEGSTEVLWDALPPAYQTDINDVVQAFGNGMDPTQWQQIQGVVAKVHSLLSTRAEFIVNASTIQALGAGEQLEAVIPQIAGLLQIIVDHTDLESLKSFDGQDFFSGPASKLMRQLDALTILTEESVSLSTLKDSRIETISSEGDKATLRISSRISGIRDKEIDFVRVDGHWLPADLVSEWDEDIASARSQLASLPETVKDGAGTVTLITSAVTGLLRPLEAAEDQGQFDVAVERMLQEAGGSLGPMLGGFSGGAFSLGLGSDSETGYLHDDFSFSDEGSVPFEETVPSEGDEPKPATNE